MNSAELPAPQIGRILVTAGLLTEDQLAEALEVQAQTSRRLGEIVVERGFISGPALANALAEQHGGVLKTEYGYATGLGGEVAKRAAAAEPAAAEPAPPLPRLRTVELPAEDAPVEPQTEAPPEPEPEPEPLPVVEPAPEPQPEPAPAPEQPLPPAAEEPPPPPGPPPAQPQRDARDEVIENLRLQLDVQQAELIALREALERERTRVETAPEPVQEPALKPEPTPEPEVEIEVEPAPAAAASAPTSSQSEHFLLCVPTSAGYVLVDRFGLVPQVGDEVEVSEEEGKFSVTKVVRLPRNSRACAYLQRDRPAV